MSLALRRRGGPKELATLRCCEQPLELIHGEVGVTGQEQGKGEDRLVPPNAPGRGAELRPVIRIGSGLPKGEEGAVRSCMDEEAATAAGIDSGALGAEGGALGAEALALARRVRQTRRSLSEMGRCFRCERSPSAVSAPATQLWSDTRPTGPVDSRNRSSGTTSISSLLTS